MSKLTREINLTWLIIYNVVWYRGSFQRRKVLVQC
ncbi:Uncharacterised protein [Vibrio cholerae]|nr:Uncharacterised protein [Vibrio cholerae]